VTLSPRWETGGVFYFGACLELDRGILEFFKKLGWGH
jgi:hypothetical protein